MDMRMLETIETDATAPRLSDGTAVSELIDLERREVSLRVHHDQEIFDLEMERIFTRSWLPVAHESEIPNPAVFSVAIRGRVSGQTEGQTSGLQAINGKFDGGFLLDKKKRKKNIQDDISTRQSEEER